MRRKVRFFAALFAAVMVLALPGCSAKTEDSGAETTAAANSGAEVTADSQTEVATNSGTETETPTLENSKAKLVYAKDNYCVAAFYGPDGGDYVNAGFCDAEGNAVGGFVSLPTLDNGWQLVVSEEFPEGYDYSGIGVIICDPDGETDENGELPSKTHLNIEQMSTEEMKEIGLGFLDGHCCWASRGWTLCSKNSFGLTYFIGWCDDYYFLTGFSDIDGFADRFSYFAGDGTPLDEYFEGYSTLEITVMDQMFDVMLVQDSGEADEEKQRDMCDELEACKPYVIYTGLDGMEQRFDLLTD